MMTSRQLLGGPRTVASFSSAGRRLGLMLLWLSATALFFACGDSGPKEVPEAVGALEVVVDGLPAAGQGKVTVTGPDSFTRAVTGDTKLTDLVPGDYTVQAEDVTIAGSLFEAKAPTSQTVEVLADDVKTVTVVYEELKGFRIAADTPASTLSFDQTRTYAFSIVRAAGFSGEITATLSGLPAGVTADQTSFSLDGTSTSFEVELTETAANEGTYALTLTATSPDAEGDRTLEMSLDVGPIVNSVEDEDVSVPGQLRYLATLARSDGETIRFDPVVFPSGERVEIALTTSIKIGNSVNILAPDYEGDQPVVALVRASKSGPVLTVLDTGIAEISHIEITDAPSMAVRNSGKLTIHHSYLHGNFYASLGAGGGGGTLTSEGDLVVTDSLIANNGSNRGGGAVRLTDGRAEFVGTRFVDNEAALEAGVANSGNGGAILALKGDVIVRNCEFVGNKGGADGGAIHIRDSGTTLLIEGSVFRENEAHNGGAVFMNTGTDLTIEGSTFDSNTATQGGALVSFSDDAEITDTDFLDNIALESGGAIRAHKSMKIEGCLIQGNTAEQQGGVINAGAVMQIVRSTIHDNHATNGNGGGVFNYKNPRMLSIADSTISGNTASGHGGGIYSEPGAHVNIVTSTIHGNEAGGSGGGLALVGEASIFATIVSTFTENKASNGGAIFQEGPLPGESAVIFSTIVRNTATLSGGGFVATPGTIMSGSIVALNSAQFEPDTAGEGVSRGHNLVMDAGPNWTMAATDILNTDPELEELADNGGRTWTIAFEEGAPPYNAVPEASCVIPDSPPFPLLFDQRGESRPQDGACDIGAYEGVFTL